MDNLYRGHTQRRTRPDLDQILSVTKSTIDDLEKTYILIDALDELTDADQQETFIESIITLLTVPTTEKAKLHVLVTSRLENRSLDGTSIEIHATREEIASMVEERIKTPRSFKQSLRGKLAESSVLQKEILDQVVSKANGMFLIADLHLKSLASMTNVRDLRETLNKLPEKLDQYYEVAWARISNQEHHLKEIAQHTISWLYLGRRQLKVDELRHALAVRPEDETFCTEGLTALADILETCQGLVVVDSHSQVVRMMHTTTHEFFQKQHDRLFKDSASYLTTVCLTYLCLDSFQGKPCDFSTLDVVDAHAKPGENIASGRIMFYRLLEYPFLDYAAENWGHHARGDPEVSFFLPIMGFLGSTGPLQNPHQVHPQSSIRCNGVMCQIITKICSPSALLSRLGLSVLLACG